MAVHFVTGKLGGGKSLVSVGRIRDYLLQGKRVATNLELNLEYLLPPGFKGNCEVFRVPDKPHVDDLYAIGRGTNSKRDEDFGLLVLDELGTWLNSRGYQQDKGRKDVIDWFLHARKYGWDVILLVQDPELIDKQVRISIGEHICICRRTDRIPIPFLSFFLKTFIGWQPKLPRIHVGTVFYGSGYGAIKVDTWVCRGNSLFRCYDTNQVFEDNPNRIAQYLPPRLLKPVNFSPRNYRYYMRLTKIYFKRFRIPFVFLAGLSLNFILLFFFSIYSGSSSAKDSQVVNAKSVAVATAVSSAEEESIPTVPVLLSYIENFSASGSVVITYFYNGDMFTFDSAPSPIYYRNSKPYMDVELEDFSTDI